MHEPASQPPPRPDAHPPAPRSVGGKNLALVEFAIVLCATGLTLSLWWLAAARTEFESEFPRWAIVIQFIAATLGTVGLGALVMALRRTSLVRQGAERRTLAYIGLAVAAIGIVGVAAPVILDAMNSSL